MARPIKIPLALLPSHRRRPLILSIAVVLGVWLFGTVSYMFIEDWTFREAFYFTLITVTTVGYGDHGISEAGEDFTLLILIGGIASATYAFSQIVNAVVTAQRDWESIMQRKISEFQNHYIVCGYGRIGSVVCQCLAHEGVQFLVIVPDQASAKNAIEQGCHALIGDCTADETLRQAGVDRARAIACVTDSDSANIVIALSAHAMNHDAFILARAENEETVSKLERAGASRVIMPVRAGGRSVADALLRPTLARFLDRAYEGESDIQLAEVTVGAGSVLDGAALHDYGHTRPELVVVAIHDPLGNRLPRPFSNRCFSPGDTLIIAGDDTTLTLLIADAGADRAAA